MKKKGIVSELVATGFGAGYLPIAPGTWGALEAVVLAWLIHVFVVEQERVLLAVFCLFFTGIGIFTSTRVALRDKLKDPSKVVIDEVAGQLLTLVWVPISIFSLVIGFLLFRLCDIVKLFPARQSERLPLGWGIMTDDLVAGTQAGLLLYLIQYLMTAG